MKMDKFTKVMIAIIAIGLIGINYNLFKDSMVKKVEASNKLDWKVVSDNDHIFIIANNGEDICNAYTSTSGMITGKWVKTHC